MSKKPAKDGRTPMNDSVAEEKSSKGGKNPGTDCQGRDSMTDCGR